MNKKIGNIFKGDKVIWMVFFFLCMISIVEVFSACFEQPDIQESELLGTYRLPYSNYYTWCCSSGSNT